MWDLPGPGLEPMFPALAGGFLITVPPGKSENDFKLLLCEESRPAYTSYVVSLNIPYETVPQGYHYLIIS